MSLMREFVRERMRSYRGEQDQGHDAFFFRSAQRFFMARPIRLRAAADKRRLRRSGLPDAVLPRLLCSAEIA
jgi:hypothetical protein